MSSDRIVIIGAGIGGLSAAALLAARGLDVQVVERAATPGGKLRTVMADGLAIDAGPTVFTLRGIFDEIFAEAGASLDDHVTLRRADTLARHAWSADERLDLFADPARSADAIGEFAGAAEARGFTAFCAEARRIHTTLDESFMRQPKTSPIGLTMRLGLARLPELQAVRPYESLWSALSGHFRDPRLRQLFGRYATYCGTSPFRAPATLMLIAHVEQTGVWLVDGGMNRLATALETLGRNNGARYLYGAECTRIVTGRRGVEAIELAGGERIAAGSVVVNADPAALGAGLFGPSVARAAHVPPPKDRSLSALTWMIAAEARGFPLLRHNVFFSGDYAAEFDAIRRDRLPAAPTVYVCAQDRDDDSGAAPVGRERLQLIVNAPAVGDSHSLCASEIETCETRTFSFLRSCGLDLSWRAGSAVRTGPAEFAAMFPSTGGALYGRASHGWAGSFLRPGSRTRIPGLYIAGGATHPGSGVPMAALSGRLASESLLADRASTRSSVPGGTAGGMSMRSATTARSG